MNLIRRNSVASSICALLVGFLAQDQILAAPIDDFSGVVRSVTPSGGGKLLELSAAGKAFDEGRLDECKQLLESARAKAPGLPPLDLMIARLFISRGKLPQGKALLERVAIKEAGHPEVYLLFGNIALSENRTTDALLHFERALNVGVPTEWTNDQKKALVKESFAGQAVVAERRQDWFKAQVALTQWMKVEPGNANVRDRLGASLFMIGREQEAFLQFQTSARQDPKMNPAEVSLAVMYLRQNEPEKAARAFQEAIKKYPTDGRVRYEFAGMLLLTDNAEEAQRQADKAVELGIDTHASKMQRGYIARQMGQFDLAEKYFSDIVAASPSDFEATNQLALVLAEQEDEAKQNRALELAKLNVRRLPSSSYAISTLGWVYYKLGKLDEAERALRLAATKQKVRSETFYFLARVLWENGQQEDARKVALRVKDAVERPGLFVLRPEIKKWFRATAIN